MVQHLLIDSRSRTEASNLQLATFELDRPLQPFTKFTVNYCQLYNTFFNITEQNNRLVVDAIIIFVPVGYYTQALLVSTISSLLQANVNPLISVTWTTGPTATWVLGTHVLDVKQSTIRDSIGVTEFGVNPTGNFFTFINTSQPQSVQFYSPELAGNDQISCHRNSLHATPFLTVPIYAPNQILNYWQPNYKLEVYTSSTQALTRLSIYLLDGLGFMLQNTADYQLHLTFE